MEKGPAWFYAWEGRSPRPTTLGSAAIPSVPAFGDFARKGDTVS
jgi:hypothetical protein